MSLVVMKRLHHNLIPIPVFYIKFPPVTIPPLVAQKENIVWGNKKMEVNCSKLEL